MKEIIINELNSIAEDDEMKSTTKRVPKYSDSLLGMSLEEVVQLCKDSNIPDRATLDGKDEEEGYSDFYFHWLEFEQMTEEEMKEKRKQYFNVMVRWICAVLEEKGYKRKVGGVLGYRDYYSLYLDKEYDIIVEQFTAIFE